MVLAMMAVGAAAIYLYTILPRQYILDSKQKVAETKTSSDHVALEEHPVPPAAVSKEVHLQQPVKTSKKTGSVSPHQTSSTKSNQTRPQASASETVRQQLPLSRPQTKNSGPAFQPNTSINMENQQKPPDRIPQKDTSRAPIRSKNHESSVPMPSKQPDQEKDLVSPAKKHVAVTRQKSNDYKSTGQKDEDVFKRAQRLADGRLKVQAIAWSDVAQDRMAVINDRVVHEGETVDGFSIVAIGQDDVVVKEKGQLWQVRFGQP